LFDSLLIVGHQVAIWWLCFSQSPW